MQPFEIISWQKPRFEAEGKGLAVFCRWRRRAGREKACIRNPCRKRFKGVEGSVVKARSPGQAKQPRGLQEDESGLREPAVGGNGLTNLVGVTIEILNP